MSSFSRMTDDYLRSLYIPHVYQHDIYAIDYQRLRDAGITLLTFDIDDTIATWLAADPPKTAKTLMEYLKGMGFRVVLLTNNKDARPVREPLLPGPWRQLRGPGGEAPDGKFPADPGPVRRGEVPDGPHRQQPDQRRGRRQGLRDHHLHGPGGVAGDGDGESPDEVRGAEAAGGAAGPRPLAQAPQGGQRRPVLPAGGDAALPPVNRPKGRDRE